MNDAIIWVVSKTIVRDCDNFEHNTKIYYNEIDAKQAMTEEFNDTFKECQLMKEDSDTLCYLETNLDDNGAHIYYVDYFCETHFDWYIKAVYVNMPQLNLDAYND